VIRSHFTRPYRFRLMRFHQRRINATASSAVSWRMSGETPASSWGRLYTPYGTTFQCHSLPLRAVATRAKRFTDLCAADSIALFRKLCRENMGAFASSTKRRHWIASRVSIHQSNILFSNPISDPGIRHGRKGAATLRNESSSIRQLLVLQTLRIAVASIELTTPLVWMMGTQSWQ